MPDPRLVGLHELKSAINKLNEANLRTSNAAAHLSQSSVSEEDLDDLAYVQQVVDTDLLPRCIELVKRLEGGTLEN